MSTITLSQLENKALEAKQLCFKNALELHKLKELQNFCDSLFWIAWHSFSINDNMRSAASDVVADYLGTISPNFKNALETNDFSIHTTFWELEKQLSKNINHFGQEYLKAFNEGNFLKCFELFNKF